LVRIARRLPARDGALIIAELFTGFRISEVLRITVGSVWCEGRVRDHISLPPRAMKGGRGNTRRVPVVPELRRSLERHLRVMGRRLMLTPDLPLFLSRESGPAGEARALSTESARRILRGAFSRAGIVDDGRLGTHSLRKAWARRVFDSCGKDPMILRAALNHQDLRTSQAYIEIGSEELDRAMRAVDFTRAPRQRLAQVLPLPPAPVASVVA
jgi:integrase